MANREISRRHFIAAGITGAALIGGSGLSTHAFAQDSSTPAATPAGGETTLVVSQVGPVAKSLGPAVPDELTVEKNWAIEGGNLQATRNPAGSEIKSSVVDQLGTAWSLPYKVAASSGALTSNPIVVDGVVYIQDAKSNVRAINLDSGKEVWYNEYNLDVPSGGPNGTAVGYGMIVYPVGTGEVVGADAGTGKEAWRISIKGWRGEGITMAPAIYDSTVYISTIPGSLTEFYNGGQRGFIFAIELASGRVLWYFDTTTDNLWGNARANSGGGLWHPPSFDDKGNIYVGTGNPGPFPGNTEFPSGSSHSGPTNYTNSIIRINPDTAGIDWFINIKPDDFTDADNQLTPVIADLNDVPMVFAAGKHGHVLGINRESGEEIWRTPVGKHKNDDLTVFPDKDPVQVYPGDLGGVETPIAYADGVVYVSLLNLATWYTGSAIGTGEGDTIADANGQVLALDGETGTILWDVTLPSPQLAGATVINDLVFTGGLDGLVRAFSIKDGTQVWSWQAGAGLNAPLAVSGDYLLVAAGGPLITSKDSMNPVPNPGAAVTALKIGGEVQAPATPGAEASPTS